MGFLWSSVLGRLAVWGRVCVLVWGGGGAWCGWVDVLYWLGVLWTGSGGCRGVGSFAALRVSCLWWVVWIVSGL